jgi:hypothetical protein
MPGIGDAMEGAVQQAPQPLRHGKAADFIRHYKPGWANSTPTVKVGGTGEPRMESARHDSNLHVASGACVAVPLADDFLRPSIGGSVILPKLFPAIRCEVQPNSSIDALKMFRDDHLCIHSPSSVWTR